VVNKVTSPWGSSGCEASWPCHPPSCGRQCDEGLAWKRDVALEISVDVDRSPTTVRFAGMLDGESAVSLTALFAELIGEGFINFELQTSALCVPDESGMTVLTGIQRLVRESGGCVAWDGLTVNHPFVALPADGSPLVIAG